MVTHESLIDLVFAKCSLVYGRDFLSRWEGLNLAEVKADWCRELGTLMDCPPAIRNGLESLPAEKPPTVLQFRALCRRPTEVPALTADVRADPAIVAKVLGAIKPVEGHDPKAWAHRLRHREHAADRLTPEQRAMWRSALKAPNAEAA
jgi:hypothetical protein